MSGYSSSSTFHDFLEFFISKHLKIRDSEFPKIQRLSIDFPLFVSPNGTGCSRYVSTLFTRGGIMASWQQSQPDLSQPLVGNFLDAKNYKEILTI